jgi:hypothetical protein
MDMKHLVRILRRPCLYALPLSRRCEWAISIEKFVGAVAGVP